jgi:hypothetical protein
MAADHIPALPSPPAASRAVFQDVSDRIARAAPGTKARDSPFACIPDDPIRPERPNFAQPDHRFPLVVATVVAGNRMATTNEQIVANKSRRPQQKALYSNNLF